MSKNRYIFAFLAIFLIIGSITQVFAAEINNTTTSVPVTPDKNPIPGLVGKTTVGGHEISPGWYYGKVHNVWPWMISDDVTFNARVNGTDTMFFVEPAGTEAWSPNAQNQIVTCLVVADYAGKNIYWHVTKDSFVDQVITT